LLYCGEQFDSTLEMYNLRARFYDPSNGRFTARDTFAGNNFDPQSLHKYLYAQADPVNRVDPSGENSDVISLNISGAMVAGLAAFTAASIYEAKTHAIGSLLVATTGAAGELLDEASIAAQNAMAAAESALLTQYRSFEEAASKAREVLRRLGNTLKKIKVVPVSQTVMPDVANNVSTAQASGHPIMLTRVSPAQAKLNRRAVTRGLGSAGLTKSWDEYPFASGRIPGTPARVVAVPALQNSIQGGVIGVAYRLEKINVGDSYFVVVIP
jgi:RHS repeat-associated protein